MNKKEILFICLIICFIFSISAVSASDIDLNDTDDTVLAVSDTDTVSVSNDLSSYSLSDNEIVRGENDGAGSFSDLKNLIDNDNTGTITLDKNYTYNESTDSALTVSGISVFDKVIQGNGNDITIDGKKISKIFSLLGTVTLKDITFINGNSAATAAVTHSAGDLTVSNCNFISNDGVNGGALQVGGSLTMESCTFINNTAVNGGAIQTTSITTGAASIVNSVFINNTATGSGGAINSPSQSLLIDNVNITGSSASEEGGAIYLAYRDLSPRITADVRVTNVNIMNSSAGRNGGGIMIRGPNAVFSNINISNTNATNGGGMYIAYCPYIMEYITFTNNHASEDGGAVYFWANGDANVEAANHLIFINNTADRDAGAVYLLGNLGTIHNSTFIGNNATNNGGAIVVKGTDWYIYDCNFTNNTAINRHGGAIYLEGSTTSVIARANFINNSAGCNGGALDWHEGASEGKLINATLINNTASRSGGAIFWHGHNGTIINAAFEYNSAKGTVLYNNSYGEETYGGDGGAIIWIGDNGQIINSTFKFNNASHNGGAIFMEGSSNGDCDNITVDYCTFVSNIAGVNGGALDWYKGAHDSTLANSTFINNTANRSGGAVYWYGHNGTIFNSTFDNNRAMGNASYTNSYGVVTYGGDGGAIIWTGANGNILNSTFIRNNASRNGGAIFMEGSTNDDCTNITVDGCEFRDNYAAVNGGALDWYQGAHDATLSNSVLVNNAAGDDGGAVYWFGHDGTIVNSTFEDNRALGNVLANDSYGRETYGGNGGAIIWTGANGNILNSTFTRNNASRNGGAIYMQGSEDGDCSNITVDGCEFRDNYAGVNGGALDWYEGAHDATLSNSVLVNNTAERSGGAVYWFGHDGTIVNSTFEDNRALGNVLANDSYGRETYGGHGGAVMWTGANGKILNSTFTRNNASRNGGAIYMQGSNEGDCSNITVDGSEFRDNYAGVNGGALDWYEGAHDATLSNSVLVNNTAERSGGAVYWYGHNGTIRNTTFANNKALGLSNNASDVGGDGGAVMWAGSDGLMDNCTFINNYAANRGGGMFLQGSELENCTNVTINNGIFKDNRAETNGGGVNFYIGATDGHIIGSTFDNNTAVTGLGGALVWRGHNGEVEGSSFTNNYARGDGGAAYIEGESCNLYNSTFDNNTAGDDGGAVYWTGDHGEIFNVTANNNKGISEGTSHSKGGTIIITGSNMTVDTLSVSNSFAEEEAGGLFLTGNYVNVTNAKFINCSASMDHTAANITQGGGAVIIGNNTRLINVTIEDSQAERGGAIYWEGHDGYAYNITATRNYAPYEGGALYVEGDNCQLYESEFTDNVAGDDGAAINWEGDNGHIEGCNFENSTALSMWDQYENRYHTSKGGAISITGDNLEIFNSNFTNSTTKNNGNNENYGGTLFITGENVKIDGCNFNDSISTGSDGGAIYIIGGHTEISNSTVSNSVARSGGAIYSTGSYCIVSNSNFTDNLADLSGGGIYWYGGSKSKYNTVDGCIFTNNTAHGNTTDKSITRGGGAIYWSEGGSYGTVKNSEFYNNSVQSTIKWKVDGGAILWDKSYHALVDNCTFVGDFVTTDGDASGTGAASVWAQGGAMYLRPQGNYTVRNCLFENCSSSKEAGALYIQGLTSGSTRMLLLENSVFINNVAEANGQYNINGGGAIQVKQCTNVIFNNVTFINNTANKGGALCVYDSVTNFVVNGANFTENKANKGSAISASVYFKLNDAVLLDNRADTTTLDLTFDRENGGSIDILMEGADTHLNAMYVKHGNKGFTVTLNNVTYWRENNITIGQTDVLTGSISSIAVGSVPEAGINITVEIFDGDNIKLHEGIYATDADGRIHLEIADILTDPYSTDNIYVKARLTNEVYYTMANETSRIQNVYVDGSALDTIFHRNATVNANITAPGNGTGQAARGIVSVYIDDIFKGNMTIENSKGTLENILTNYTADEFFTVGKHNVSLKYWGDAYFDEANTTIQLNIIKAQSNVTFTIEDLGYDLYMNFTVFDDWNDKAYWDANGTATVMFYAENDPTFIVRLADVSIVNGVGYAVLRDLIPRNYTIKTTYHDDNNYNDSVSETNYTLPQKDYAAVIIDVNAYDIMVNETVYINITIVPPDGYEVPGNVTLYLDNKGYNLTLTMGDKNATAKFNMTNLTAGIKKVVAFYQGSKLLEPTKGEADFRVLKYNSTISANVTNITIVQNEVINITLLNDTTGIVSVIVDGKEYFDRIKNGTASVKLPQLPMGEYNVTLFYEGDHKYNNVTNYTVFYVGPVTPEMIIDVENVTYGNSTHIVITIPDCSEGNVSIKIDGVPFDVPKPVDNGRVEFVVEDLNAGNYTVEATYTGDTNHTAVSGEQNFTVYKANRTIDLEVQNITYGGIEHIEVYVNATGNVTIIVDGKNKTIELNEGKATLDVSGLNASEYSVEVIYNGNENYNKAYAKATFIVSTLNTNLVIDDHNVPVWDNEYINVTVRNSTGGIAVNATGNITIYIDGVPYTANITDGVARFNITTSQVGQKVIWAFYDGDINFVGNRSMETFEVQQRSTPVEVTAQNITVGQDGKITINIPANATGYVILSGNFTNNPIYVYDFTNGVAEITVDNLAVGNYSVHVKYIGDALDNYTVAENDTTFKVETINTTISIDVESIDYGNKVNITVTVNDNATGYITIRINETRNITLPVANGKVNWIVEDLAAGNYTVYANYSGDAKYNVNETNKAFEVRQISPEIEIIRVISTADDNATIIVKVDPRVTENVTVTVNNKPYSKAVDEKGIAVITTDVLDYGTYTINASYAGDKNFTKDEAILEFTTNATSDYLINITASDIKVGNNTNITVNVPSDAAGKVIIELNGTNYTAIISGGKAVLNNVSILKEGVYNVTAYFGNDKYANKTVETRFAVTKVDYPITITVVNETGIYVGDTVKVVVSLPEDVTENVTIEINGQKFTNSTVDGNATFYVPAVTYGNKTVVATYPGDDKYVFNAATANFTVSKRQSQVNVTATGANVGENATITVNIPTNATGYVIVNVDGINYTVNTTDGVGSVEIANLGNKTYTVKATYIGDDQYLASENNTVTFTMDKIQPVIVIEGKDIEFGQDEVISIELDQNITDVITIDINGKNYTAFVVEGKGNLTVPGLAAGDYEAVAYYRGDDKFLNATSAVAAFKVNATSDLDIVIEVQNITFGDKQTITVYVNATGTVNITVDEVSRDNLPIQDGKVVFEVPDYLTAGNYTVYVDYNGNDNYTNVSAHRNFTVEKADPVITVNVQNITYGDAEHIIVHVNAEGNVTITTAGNSTTILLGQEETWILRAIIDAIPEYDGKATWNIENLPAGVYPVEVTYNGNENYNSATVKAIFTVSQQNTTVSVEVEDIRVDGKEVINVTLSNKNATGNVTINVDGKNYTAVLKDGKANITLDKLSNATHSVVVIYEGDHNFNGNWTSATFNVTKVKPTLTIDVTNKTVGETELITINLPENATGYVVVDVDGTKYHVDIVEGQPITLEVPKLENKTYAVTATYSGDGYYDTVDNSTSFNVSKVESQVTVKVENITVGDVEAVNITVTTGATGNVTIKIGDEYEKTVGVIDGVISVIVPGLTVGNKTVDVTYNGDDKYLPSKNSTTFVVSKVNTTETSIKVINQGNGTVVVTVPDNATGNVTIKIGDENYTAPVVNGTAVITLTNATPGTHDIEVIYSGDENHTAATVDSTVTIPKYDTPIDVTVSDIKVGDKAVVEVKLPENATGNVTIEINGKEYTTDKITDGVARFEVENLTYDNKTVAVKYSGDDNYVGNFTTGNFTVDKRESFVTVDVEPANVGEDVTVKVNVPENATGWVHVTIDNQTYAIKVTDGTGTAAIKGLASGNHTVDATYLGDDQYFNSTNGTTVEVSKVPASINVTVDDITVGENAVINIETPEDLCGNVTVTVDGKNYTVPVSGGKGTLVVPDLKPDNYTVDVAFDGCKKYEPANNSTTFEVSKVNTTETSIKVIDQGNGTVVVTVPDDATGNVTIKIGDENYTAPVVNGTAVITLTNATPGTHDIEVIYSGDENHTGVTKDSTVTIPKYDTPIKVTTENINVGDAATITVEVPENATGNVTIEIDGVKYTEEIKDGKAVFTVENLTAGDKTVAVDYAGDDNYVGNHTTGNFTVSKVAPEITVKATDSTVGDKVVIEVTAPNDVTRPVLVDVGGKGYYVNITDGKGTLELDDLTSGNYTVSAKFLGDDKYTAANATGNFKVDKVPSTISVEVDDIPVGDKAVITVKVPKDATGNVTVTVDGKDYNVSVADGKGTLVIPGLKAGNYTVEATYNGDDKYESSSNSSEFEVSKKDTEDMKIIDQGNGTVVVVVGDNATGNVTVKVGNNTYTVPVENGTAVVDLTNATPGTHDVEIIYSGDDTHEGQTTDSTVTIPKLDTPISVDVKDSKVGEPAVITVNVPENATGNVTIEIDGKEYTTEIKDGKAVFEVPDLTVGNKTVAVEYVGDDNYIGNHTTAKFTVSKVPSTVNATIEDSKVGENVTVKITVPEDASGQVLVDINGVGYYVNVTNGTGSVEIPRVPSGKYDVNVTYLGDDKYLPSSNKTSFNVDKLPSYVIPTAKDIAVGDTEKITFELPSDATGTITVTIDGEEFTVDLDKLGAIDADGNKFTVAVSDGKAVLTINDLPKGEYTVEVRYNGDDKYMPSTNSTKFTVSKTSTDMEITDNGDGTVKVVLPDDATGNVTVKVGNETYTVPVVNGTAIVNLTNATPGKHDVEIIYSGDDKYGRQDKNTTVTIPKYDTPISVEVEDISVGDTAKITVNVPDGATGNVTIEINGKEYSAEIKDGKAVFEVPDLAAGDKTVAVKYVGDKNYVGNFTTGNFTVSKVDSTSKATSKDIKVGKDEVITVTVPKDATGRVLVEIDGVGYYADIVNGKAKVIIPELPSGKYTAKVTYEGDDKYLPSTTTTKFTVTKVSAPISATGDKIEQGEDATVVVNLPSDATGTVTITVDGKKYTAEVKDGKAVFVIPGLTPGDHDVTAVYSGDKKYDANDTITDIDVVYPDNPNPVPEPEHGDQNGGIDLAQHSTGNPILVLLMILMVLGSTQLRRFKK